MLFNIAKTFVKLHVIINSYLFRDSQIQGVQEKFSFFTIHWNPSLAYITVRYLQSSQRNASEQSLLLAGIFEQPIAAECWREGGGKLSRILGKKHNI